MKRTLFFLICWLFIAGCSKHMPYYYTIGGMRLYNADNSGPSPVDAATSDVPAKAYAIRVEYTNLLKDTLAHDDESSYSLLYPVQVFTITSLTDFDSSHPAGSNLNSYFLIPKIFDASGGAGLAQKPPKSWTGNDYLWLMTPPTSLGNRSFVVHLETADHASFTDTITVNLLP